MAQQDNKHSLLEPNLSGLSCTAWIKNEDASTIKIILAHFVLFMLLFSWIFGYVLVIVFIALLYTKYYTCAALLGTILFTPVIIPLPRSSAWCRFLMNAPHYFNGGCSLSYEHFPLFFQNNETSDKASSDKAPSDKAPSDKAPSKQMHCYHPHGLFTMGGLMNGGIRASAASDSNISPQVRAKYVGKSLAHRTDFVRHAMIDPLLYKAPLFRPLMDLAGCVTSAGKKAFIAYMQNGGSFGLVPGGFYDVMLFKQSVDCIYIKKKKGFIKYALQFGYTILPVYTFGECETYFNMDFAEDTKKWMSDWRIPPVCWFYGEYIFCPFMPFRNIGLHTIIGQGIECPKIEKPTQKDIDQYHEKYLKAVVLLFDRNKWRFGWQHKELQVH